MRINTTRGALV